ncbi:hypothetical protein WB44_04020 [Synechococcus sp. WH 8020]|nr:hypothetical protein WB44_04020 [Synechococcus sp. WH 8020]
MGKDLLFRSCWPGATDRTFDECPVMSMLFSDQPALIQPAALGEPLPMLCVHARLLFLIVEGTDLL